MRMDSKGDESVGNTHLCSSWHLVALTLMLLDHIYTLDVEIKHLWKRRAKISAYLFFVHRYFNPLAAIFSVLSVCHALVHSREALIIFAQVMVVVILTLRVYALYGCNKPVLWFMIVVQLILIVIVCISTFIGHNTQPKANGSCHTVLDQETSTRQARAWLMLFIFDTVVFVLATINAIRTWRELKIIRRMRVSLHVVLLRDGALYFGFMSIVNLVNILTFYLAEGCMRGGLAPVASSLSVTLISRLMLNLHEVMDIGIYMGSWTSYSNQSHPQVETHIVFNHQTQSSWA
ncbi:hypothetical protein L218DRAFT_232872 [Marasmius fiardii PR-910]|nr:hypothetical protein L218DRAFT_232872 [Marasmius fiardii PR-910]